MKDSYDEKDSYNEWPWDSVRPNGEIHADYLKKAWPSPEDVINEWKTYSWMPGEKGESVLDVGCGHARYLDYFVNIKHMNYAGLDNSERMIEICHETYPDYNFVKAAIPQNSHDDTKLPFEDNVFDLIFCWDVLRHLFSAEGAVLPEFFRVAKKYVVVSQVVSLNNEPVIFQHPHGTMEIDRTIKEIHELMDDLAQEANCILLEKHFLYGMDRNRENYIYVFKNNKDKSEI